MKWADFLQFDTNSQEKVNLMVNFLGEPFQKRARLV